MQGPEEELASLIEYAKWLAAAGHWNSEAVAVNSHILKLRPGSLAACNRLATCGFHLGYLDRAEELCRQILRLDPHNLTAQQRLDAVTIRRKHGELADALDTFQDAFQEGLKARRRGNNNLATVLLEKACRLQADDACCIALAASYRATSRLADAETLYRSILDKGFNKAAAVGLAAVLRDQGRLDKAAALDEEVLKRFPDNDHAHWGLRGVAADKRKPPWERKSFFSGSAAKPTTVPVKHPATKRDAPRKTIGPVQAYFDGLCEPRNPGGYACGGWHIEPHPEVPALAPGLDGHAFYRHDPGATNNIAEYSAALDALRAIYRTGYTGRVALRGDSQLVINQFNGKWKCHKPQLQELLDRLHYAAAFFDEVTLTWVPREQNTRADELSRQAYDNAARGLYV